MKSQVVKRINVNLTENETQGLALIKNYLASWGIKKNQSDIIRDAIENYYRKIMNEATDGINRFDEIEITIKLYGKEKENLEYLKKTYETNGSDVYECLKEAINQLAFKRKYEAGEIDKEGKPITD